MTASQGSFPIMIKQLMKKQPRQPEAPAEVSFADRIRAARKEAEEFIEAKVDELKARPEGQTLPRDWLAMNLRALNGGHCNCRVALSLLEKETKNG